MLLLYCKVLHTQQQSRSNKYDDDDDDAGVMCEREE